MNPANEAMISESGKFRRYIVEDTMYEVRKYSYGTGGQQTSTRRIRKAEYLSNSGTVIVPSKNFYTNMSANIVLPNSWYPS